MLEVLQVQALPVMIANDLADLDIDSSDDDEAVGDLPAGPRVEEAAQLTSAAMVRRSCSRLLNVQCRTCGSGSRSMQGQLCTCQREARHCCRMQWQQLEFEGPML